MVEREHPHVAGEAEDRGLELRLREQAVEELPGVEDVALRSERALDAVLRGEAAERPLEVRRELAGVVARCAACDAVGFEEQHAPVGVRQREERGRHPGDARADDRDVGAGVLGDRRRRRALGELFEPG